MLRLIRRPFYTIDGDLGTGDSNRTGLVRTSSPLSVHSQQPPNVNIWVDILLTPPYSTQPPVIKLMGNLRQSPIHLHLAPLVASSPSHASLLYTGLDPTINFVSSYPVNQRCIFSIYNSTSCLPLHSEVAQMSCLCSPQTVDNPLADWLYCTSLAPKFWETVRANRRSSTFVLLQRRGPY